MFHLPEAQEAIGVMCDFFLKRLRSGA